MIWGFIGHEGGGKSATMTYINLLHLSKGGGVFAFPGFEIRNPNICLSDGSHPVLSTPIDMKDFIFAFRDEEKLRNVMASMDEIQNFFGSEKYMTMYNSLITKYSMQRRKINFGITYTVQSWNWIDPRLRQLTHFLTVCKDLSRTIWGKEVGLKRGQVIDITTYDCKGFITGEEWGQLRHYTLNILPIRDWYDSYSTVDPLESFRKLVLIKPEDKLDLRNGTPQFNPLDDSPLENVPDDVREISQENNARLLSKLEEQLDPATLIKVSKAMRKAEK
ncbi:hypothetical protein DA01_08735 [Dehalococcoides mccartyi]|uniref:Uncharacterized protein n=1 Tax=Dehalococcoides mccartyi TaxID=61435 RepID=A0A0V8LX99_9CHLR|nr:hypothetical protein [Dehalococcoides mccartyi]KSV16166.1 hypothetical protein DA01_08735 [Dehalococcoides mccartyi]